MKRAEKSDRLVAPVPVDDLRPGGSPNFLVARNDETAADWEVREAYGSLLPFASVGGGVSWQGPGEQRFGSVTLAQDQPAYYLSNYDVGITYQLDGRRLLEPTAARARSTAARRRIVPAACLPSPRRRADRRP